MDPNTNGHTILLKEDLILVDLDVSVWGARERLAPADLDKAPQEIPDNVVLGHKKLLPPNALHEITSLRSQSRTVLERYGYRFPIGQARAVPVGVLSTVEEKLNTLQAQFTGAVEAFLSLYPSHQDSMLSQYPRELQPSDYLMPDDVRRAFRFQWVAVNIALPTDPENAKKVRERLDTWIDEIAQEFRVTAAGVFNTVREKLQKGELVSQASFNAITRAIERLQQINFLQDHTVEAQLQTAREILQAYSAKDCREAPSVAQTVRTTLDSLVGEIRDTSDIDIVTGAFKRKLRL